ncbi:MAG: hypothetical protein HOK97_24180 [Deltaproteobacteria bacterium]|jgi:hypothetical protein|nr:hypothetical protein [Deltaproteobacteria bacterium]
MKCLIKQLTVCLFFLFCLACGETNSETNATGCFNDFDCKDDRVCENRECIEPSYSNDELGNSGSSNNESSNSSGESGTSNNEGSNSSGNSESNNNCNEGSAECISAAGINVCRDGDWQYYNCYDVCEDLGQTFIVCDYNNGTGQDDCFCGSEKERCIYDQVFIHECEQDPQSWSCTALCAFMEDVCYDPVCDNSSIWDSCQGWESTPSTAEECLDYICHFYYEATLSDCP